MFLRGVGHSFNFKQYIDSEIAKHIEEHLCGIIKKSSFSCLFIINYIKDPAPISYKV